MTTLSQFPPTLEVTAADDDMEITSDIGRYDHDVDIDLDITSEHAGDDDGDFMLDDIASESGNAAATEDQDMLQDNLMQDDEASRMLTPRMDDDAGFVDEHLTDASLEGAVDNADATFDDVLDDVVHPDAGKHQQQPDIQSAIVDTNEDPDHTLLDDEVPDPDSNLNDHETVDETHVRDFSHPEPGVNEGSSSAQAELTEHRALDVSAVSNSTSTEPAHGETFQGADQEPAATEQASDTEKSKFTEDVATDPHEHGHEYEHEQLDKLTSDPNGISTAGGQDSTSPFDGVSHSINVSYYGTQISLFPPMNNDQQPSEYFLEDRSLASRSIAELLRSCREVLGNTITNEEELKLASEELGLDIGEDSAHAFSTSLSEILDVYLELHHLDGIDEPGPFEITLERKERFTAALSRLRAAVADGRGMSQLWLGGDDEEDNDEVYDDATPSHAAATEDKSEVVLEAGASNVKNKTGSVHTPDAQTGPAENEPADEIDYEEVAEFVDGADASTAFDGGSTQLIEEPDLPVEDDVANVQGDSPRNPSVLTEGDGEEQKESVGSSQSSTVAGDTLTAHDQDVALNEVDVEQNLASLGTSAEVQHQSDSPGAVAGDALAPEKVETEYPVAAEFEDGEVEQVLERASEQQDRQQDYEATELDGATGNEFYEIGWEDDNTHEVHTDNQQSTDDQEAFEHVSHEADSEEHGRAETNDELVLDKAEDSHTLAEDSEDAVQAPNETVDDFDEITFDEDEDDEDFAHEMDQIEHGSTARQASESPSGKRSWTDHIDGDKVEAGSSSGAKRVRSS